MKKPVYILTAVVTAILINSCAPVYKCGETRPSKTPIYWGSNLRKVIDERDILCINLSAKENENSRLRNEILSLTNERNNLLKERDSLIHLQQNLQGRYDNLISDNLSQIDQFNKALKAKSDELASKEKLLFEREKAIGEMTMALARQDSITQRLNAVLRNAMLGFNPDELMVEIKNGKVYVSMSDKLLFKSGSSTVEEKGREALKVLADVLGKNPDIDILVEGHTDNVPIRTPVYKDNWDLSVARATAIVRILTGDNRISPVRMTASGKGEYYPRADNQTAEGRALNRRTEIILSPKLQEIMQLLTR